MKPVCLIFILVAVHVAVSSAASIEDVASKSALIVHCRLEKGDESQARFTVVETWKGAYSREAFVPIAPPGFIFQAGRSDLPAGEAVLFYFNLRQAGGKFQRYDLALPIADGKITFPTGAIRSEPARTYTVAAFKTAVQAAVKFPLVNGDFDASAVGSIPEGWKPAYPTGGAVVATDGKDTFVRLTNAQPQNAGVLQDVPVPNGADRIAVLGRMRGKPKNEKEEKRAAVEVALRFKDAKGESINAAMVSSDGSAAWRTFRREFAVPPGSASVEVVARSIFAIGTFDFDSVRVEFK
jgi:hypothetical protein